METKAEIAIFRRSHTLVSFKRILLAKYACHVQNDHLFMFKKYGQG